MSYDHIGVVGGGAWGAALAIAAARAGRQVTLWEHDAANAAQLANQRESLFLPGVRIDDGIAVTRDCAMAARADALLLVVPAQAMRPVVTTLAPLVAAGTPLLVCAKGIEAGTHAFMSDIVAECAPKAVPAILSGPSFAADVARGLPTAVTLAARDEAIAAALARAIGSATFRPYHSTDLRGVEIGGAAKNVLAIGAGIVAGRGFGASATAALITRGFAELTRFGRAFGARPETLTGLSGLGDLVLTCSTPQSRNFSFGFALGKGRTPDEVRAGAKLSEGVFTAPVLVEMAREKGVEMPISAAVAAILDGTLGVGDAIEGLLTRPFRAEG
jgi:glycerol-3-phosphate dehydrogenase (NAD(P)+)